MSKSVSGCTQDRILDVFVTKQDVANNGEPYEFDDEFLCSVQTVQLANNNLAALVAYPTCYIMPMWSIAYDHELLGQNKFKNIEVGDIVRIGNPNTGTTDYLTVLEVIHVDGLANTLGSDYNDVALSPKPLALAANGSSYGDTFYGSLEKRTQTANSTTGEYSQSAVYLPPTTYNSLVALEQFDPYTVANHVVLNTTPIQWAYPSASVARFKKEGIAHIVLRVNATMDLTSMPPMFVSSSSDSYASRGQVQFTTKALAMKYRYKAKLPVVGNGDQTNYMRQLKYVDGVNDLEVSTPMDDQRYAYPLYVNKKWAASSTLYAALDHGVKSLASIKLVQYSIVNKRQVGVNNQHEMINDDYFIVHINELNGKLISNNKFANGAFCVLHCPLGDQSEGAIEHSLFDPQGIATHYFDNQDSTVRNLSIKVTDRLGRPAHIGRLHLWFKLHVLHG